ncbi:MAG: fumarate hydratase [Victivallales bacterium]|nr:fumarate hydratase [Victivallales bacterium]
MNMRYDEIVEKVAATLVAAGSTFTEDKKEAYRKAIAAETNPPAKWGMETILQNADAAELQRSPLCDDTGIPHLVLDVGDGAVVTGEFLDAIREGVSEGLRRLPGRPMGIMGDDVRRIDQSGGLDEDPAGVLPAPFHIRRMAGNGLKLHVLMFGGGPAIRGKTLRVFHKHDVNVVLNEIIGWAKEGVSQLGCSPCTLGVGIGRSHYEAATLMLEALVDGSYDRQSEMESQITLKVNEADIGPLGLHGKHSVLATFLKVGPQRASGVRIVCLRPCCCFEPRIATVVIY